MKTFSNYSSADDSLRRSLTASIRSLAACGGSVGLCLGLLLAPAKGVAQSHADSIRPLPAELRERWGTIGLASPGPVPEFTMHRPVTKGQAAKNSIAQWPGLSEGLAPDIRLAAFQVAWAPVGVVFGGAQGAFTGVSVRKLNAATGTLTKVGGQIQNAHGLENQLAKLTREKNGHDLVLVTNPVTDALTPPLRWANFSPITQETPALTERKPAADHRELVALREQGVDTVLEITVLSHGLIGKEGVNPPLSVEVALCVRLIRVRDGAELYAIYPRYDGGCQKFTQWAANNGQPLREEVQHAYQELSGRIMEKLNLSVDRITGGTLANAGVN